MSRRNNLASVGTPYQFGQHDMGFRHLTSLGFFRLQPIVMQECVPNDQITCDIESVVTNAPFASAMQSRCLLKTAAFYVRNRVLWDGWNEYITGISNYAIPTFDGIKLNQLWTRAITERSIPANDCFGFWSSMGLPVDKSYAVPNKNQTGEGINTKSLQISMLPLRAYRRVWWDWFRDSNVIPDTEESSYLSKSSVAQYFETPSDGFNLPFYACWSKDWMTNNLRTPNGDSRTLALTAGATSTIDNVGATIQGANVNTTSAGRAVFGDWGDATQTTASLDTRANVLDRSNYSTSGSDINSLRTASALQKWLEKCNVLGGRMRDRLLGMFGSSVSAESLNMSEYLGGGQIDLTGETQSANTSGNASANSEIGMQNPFGASNGHTIKGQLSTGSKMQKDSIFDHTIKYHVQEHGYFIVLAWVMPDVFECGGLNRMWIRGTDGIAKSRFDFLTPELVGTGFQPILNMDVYLPPSTADDVRTSSSAYSPFRALGYRGRYEDYKYNTDIISGCFRDKRYMASMRNMFFERDLLRENGYTNSLGEWVEGMKTANLIKDINHDTLSQTSATTAQAYNDKFMYTGSAGPIGNDATTDYFICNFKIALNMVRPVPSVTAPKIESASAAPVNIGGTRL